jgi:hypothetical protein
MILLPLLGKQLDISSRSSRRKVHNQHYDNMVKYHVEVFDKEIHGFGCDPERLRTLYYTRWVWNSFAFPYYVKHRGGGAQKFTPDYVGLFDDPELAA